MKDRILFFVLGAVLATAAYFAGDMDKAGAQEETMVIDRDLLIRGELIIEGGVLINGELVVAGTSTLNKSLIVDRDIYINGILNVAGGAIHVSQNPNIKKSLEELESTISMTTTEDGATIRLVNGPSTDPLGQGESSLTLSASDNSGSSKDASIRFMGNNRRLRWSINSNDKQHRDLFK